MLASLDFLGEPDRLWAEAERTIRPTGPGCRSGAGAAGRRAVPTAAPNLHQYGADPSNAVRVQVDGRGRVESVDVDHRWRERVAVAGFGAAVFEAYTQALRGSYQAAAHAVLRAHQPAPGRTGPARSVVGPAASAGAGPAAGGSPVAGVSPLAGVSPVAGGSSLDGVSRGAGGSSLDGGSSLAGGSSLDGRSPVDGRVTGPEWARRIRAVLDDLDVELDGLANRRPPPVTPERSVTSPRGCFTLRLRGQHLTGVSGDPGRIGVSGPEQLRLDVLAAFQAAALSTRT
nr:hypothetical protein [Micromonospora sp. DSM 115978]